MKNVMAFVVCALVLMGCDKLKGDKGDKGDPGPGRVQLITGAVSSNDFSVAVPVNPAVVGALHVFISDGSDWSELPYFLPASGVNTYFLYTPGSTSGTVRILNGVLAGGTEYQIVVITT